MPKANFVYLFNRNDKPNGDWSVTVHKTELDRDGTLGETATVYRVTQYRNKQGFNCDCPAAYNGNSVKGPGLPCKHTLWVNYWLKLPEAERHNYMLGTNEQLVLRPKMGDVTP